jgi:PIN domain nuclease of toxin-antitoxin system
VGSRQRERSVIEDVTAETGAEADQDGRRACRPAAYASAAPVRLLLDTCTFLWLAGGSSLSPAAAAAVRDPANDVLLSAVSSWEIATKYLSGRLPLPEPPDKLIPTERHLRGVLALPFDEESALQGLRLPPLHRDPFDRMLISQAIALSLAIVTPDPLITQYPVRVIW